MPRRLISTSKSEIRRMTAQELKHSIRASEGRVVLGQSAVDCDPMCEGNTNMELDQAFGADIILMNGYSMDPNVTMPGLRVEVYNEETSGFEWKDYRLKDMKKLVDLPLGIYLECGLGDDVATTSDPRRTLIRPDRVASEENLKRVLEEEADFVILGGNPGTRTDMDTIIEATVRAKRILGDKVLIMTGKWEDGVYDKVLGDPLAKKDGKEAVKELIDAGADVICLPMPGSRTGITVDMIRELVEYTHSYKEGTLALSFLGCSVEGSDMGTIRELTIMSRMTGADIHAIGDAGMSGVSIPENIYQMSLSVKGRRLTFYRLAATRR